MTRKAKKPRAVKAWVEKRGSWFLDILHTTAERFYSVPIIITEDEK